MLRKVLLIAVPVLIVGMLAAIVVVPPMFRHEPGIETRAVGVWQETGSAPRYRLTILRTPAGAYGHDYSVSYPRSFKVPFPAALVGDEIHIWGENTKDVVWVVNYNERTDTLILTRPGGGGLHGLRRVSD
jgi:hypothetical protein